jgi:hypothetical protein
MKYPWLMLDLETLSTRPTAVILSIGAAPFDLDGVRPPIRIVLNISTQRNRHIDPNTVMWWMGQSEKARSVFVDEKKVGAGIGLTQFNEFCNDMLVPIDERGIWGNGSDFDNVLLANLYEWQNSYGRIERPWKHTGNRCFRTLKNICRQDYDTISKQVLRETHHDAADDAAWQAEVCRRLLRKIEAARRVVDAASVFCADGDLPINPLEAAVRSYEHV